MKKTNTKPFSPMNSLTKIDIPPELKAPRMHAGQDSLVIDDVIDGAALKFSKAVKSLGMAKLKKAHVHAIADLGRTTRIMGAANVAGGYVAVTMHAMKESVEILARRVAKADKMDLHEDVCRGAHEIGYVAGHMSRCAKQMQSFEGSIQADTPPSVLKNSFAPGTIVQVNQHFDVASKPKEA